MKNHDVLTQRMPQCGVPGTVKIQVNLEATFREGARGRSRRWCSSGRKTRSKQKKDVKSLLTPYPGHTCITCERVCTHACTLVCVSVLHVYSYRMRLAAHWRLTSFLWKRIRVPSFPPGC